MLATLVVVAATLLGLAAIMASFDIAGLGAAIGLAAIGGIVNALLWPLIVRIALPLTVLTFGIAALVRNGAVTLLAAAPGVPQRGRARLPLSDHGQTQGATFLQRYGETLEALVARACEAEPERSPRPAPARTRRAAGPGGADRGGRLRGRRWAAVRAVTRGRTVDGAVRVGEEPEATAELPELAVMASGCLGLISFPQLAGRVTREQIDECWPALLPALREHPGSASRSSLERAGAGGAGAARPRGLRRGGYGLSRRTVRTGGQHVLMSVDPRRPRLFAGLRLPLSALVIMLRDREERGPALLVASLLIVGTVFYALVEGWGVIDAVYFSAMSLATVGYGDLVPETPEGKLFTVVYVLAGIGILVSFFTALTAKTLTLLRQRQAERESAG